jgi:hypothetical protein
LAALHFLGHYLAQLVAQKAICRAAPSDMAGMDLPFTSSQYTAMAAK